MTDDELALEEEFARTRLSRATASRLLGYMRPYKGLMAGNMSLELLWVSSMLLGPHLVKLAIDREIAREFTAAAWTGLLWVCGFYAANLLARIVVVVAQIMLAGRAGLTMLRDLRSELFAHINRLSLSYFDRTKEGRIIARIDRDVDALEEIVVWGPLELTSCVLSLVLVLAQMMYYDWRLSLAVGSVVPVIVIGSDFFRRRGLVAYRKVREGYSKITGHLAESINGVKVLQAFVRERDNRNQLRRIHEQHNDNVNHAAVIWNAYLPFMGFMYVVGIVIILTYGSTLVGAGEMQIGEVTAFLLLLGMFFGPVEGLGNLYNQSLSAATAAERIFLLLDTEPDVVDRSGARALPAVVGRLRFDAVDFTYTGSDRPVLQGIDLDLAAGQTLALVGQTGAGKSTLVNLLARFYEPTRGTVRIDDTDICEATLASLRSQLGIVPQDGFLFTGTVLDNLRYGRPDASEDEVVDAARELGTHEIFSRLPDGYHTEVKERGEGLSHGERQLITLTRALVADPRILILDEATSAVDTLTEQVIQGAIDRLRSARTTVVVAHRLSTIFSADQILVLHEGRIVERGTHGELIDAGGRYADLYAGYVRN